MSGVGHSASVVLATGDQAIDGLLGQYKWATSIQYSFPLASGEYTDDGSYSEAFSFGGFSTVQQNATRWILDTAYGTSANNGFSVEGFTNLGVSKTTSADAHLRFAESSDPSTAWAYSPGSYYKAGDVWIGKSFNYDAPEAGNYGWATFIHETGHALGLSHGHETSPYGKLPSELDSMEFSIMTYRSYVGAPLTGYVNETFGYAQSFMMLDIAALQEMYGADYSTNGGDTVYKWNPNSGDTLVNGQVGIDAGGNRIFATVWDGGGTDTYDLSSYSTDLAINLTPGEHSVFSAVQLANLGHGNISRGNIFNALMHNGDTRSLIENVIAGSGDDQILGNIADNRLDGGAGEDILRGDNGEDSLYGGTGNDNLYGDAGNDRSFAGTGNDRLYGGSGNDYLKGQSGDDYLSGQSGSDRLRGGTGNDILDGGGNNDVLEGDDGKDNLYGDTGNDKLYGGSDGDRLFAGTGNDRLYGGSGNDYLKGQSGDDYLSGQSGSDRLRGGTGNDILDGGSSSDVLEGEGGKDSLYGDTGNDKLYGGSSGDRLFAGTGNDRLYGGSGNDYLKGQSGDDYLSGQSGSDRLRGGTGNDILDGGDSNDVLEGEGGDDLLKGGTGDDTFVFSGSWGDDTITDFNVTGNETLDFSTVSGITSMSDLGISYGGGDTTITFGSESIVLSGTTTTLMADDFIF